MEEGKHINHIELGFGCIYRRLGEGHGGATYCIVQVCDIGDRIGSFPALRVGEHMVHTSLSIEVT